MTLTHAAELDPRLVIALFPSVASSIFGSATLVALKQTLRDTHTLEDINDACTLLGCFYLAFCRKC